MKRSAHVTVAAVTILAASAASLLWTIPLWASSLSLLAHALHDRGLLMVFIELALWRAFLIALAVWGIVTAIALLRLRPRARHSAVLFSFVALVVAAGDLYLVSSAVAETDANRHAFELLLLALIPLWWLILFTRTSVRRQFDSPAPAAQTKTP